MYSAASAERRSPKTAAAAATTTTAPKALPTKREKGPWNWSRSQASTRTAPRLSWRSPTWWLNEVTKVATNPSPRPEASGCRWSFRAIREDYPLTASRDSAGPWSHSVEWTLQRGWRTVQTKSRSSTHTTTQTWVKWWLHLHFQTSRDKVDSQPGGRGNGDWLRLVLVQQVQPDRPERRGVV